MTRMRASAIVPSFIAVFVAGWLATVHSQSPQSAAPQGRGPIVPQSLRERAQRDGRVRVLVQLRLPGGVMASEPSLARTGGAGAVLAQRQDIGDVRGRILARMAGSNVRETAPVSDRAVRRDRSRRQRAGGARVVT